MKKIFFTDIYGVGKKYKPVPSLSVLPKWYVESSSYANLETSDEQLGTIKKCTPVFDAISSGYILFTCVDINISQENGHPNYRWQNSLGLQFHPIEQAEFHPSSMKSSYPKWVNPWGIKTPEGYSTLFLPPLHRESVFSILSGIVDTDSYIAPVNLPFVLNDVEWEGVIQAGTPMAQVIPIKREDFESEVTNSIKSIEEQGRVTEKLHMKVFNSYRSQFWKRKKYK